MSPFSFGVFVSKIKETMMLEDPETTIERLYHEMYADLEATLASPTIASENKLAAITETSTPDRSNRLLHEQI